MKGNGNGNGKVDSEKKLIKRKCASFSESVYPELECFEKTKITIHYPI